MKSNEESSLIQFRQHQLTEEQCLLCPKPCRRCRLCGRFIAQVDWGKSCPEGRVPVKGDA